jgi:hypothetical protein
MKRHGLIKTSRSSVESDFVAKAEDMIGLYFNPPSAGLAICDYEKGHFKPAIESSG